MTPSKHILPRLLVFIPLVLGACVEAEPEDLPDTREAAEQALINHLDCASAGDGCVSEE